MLGAKAVTRAGLGAAQRASPESRRQVWACWVWAQAHKLLVQKNLGAIEFRVKELFSPEIFCVQKIFSSKKILSQKKFGSNNFVS